MQTSQDILKQLNSLAAKVMRERGLYYGDLIMGFLATSPAAMDLFMLAALGDYSDEANKWRERLWRAVDKQDREYMSLVIEYVKVSQRENGLRVE